MLPILPLFTLPRGAAFDGDTSKKDYVGQDYERAVEIAPAEWRTWHYRIKYLSDNNLFEASYMASANAYKRFKENPVIAMDYAKALLNTNRSLQCVNVLNKTLVLPQEGAQEGHELFEMANLSLALQMIEQKKYQKAIKYVNEAKKWPENLGSGSPYNPDNRLQDYIAAYCEDRLGNQEEAENYFKR